MKKLLTATLAIAMSATFVGALASCKNGSNDAEAAKEAITSVRTLHNSKVSEETASDYTVMGQIKVDSKMYTVNWSVAPAEGSTIENFSNYVSVGEMNESSKQVTVSIKKASEAIEYTLDASVTVGKAVETASFTHKVPASAGQGDRETVTKSISFSDKTNRTVYNINQQVWTQNGITLTNDKGASTTDVGDYTNPVRLYKSSSIKIEYEGMFNIVFHSRAAVGTSTYPANLKGSLEAAIWASGATITADEENNTVTVLLATPVNSLEFTASAGQIQLNSIDIEAYVGGVSDAEKVAAAKLNLDVIKNYTATGDYDLPATQNGANIAWAIKGTSANASIDGGKLKITSMPAAETEITLVATITSGTETDTKEITVKLVPLAGVTHAGTAEDPYTPSEAKKVTALLAADETAATDVWVKGYVIAPGTYSSNYGNFDNMYIADEYAADKKTTAEDALYVFRPKPDGTYLTESGFLKGDLVTFKGKLQNYKGNTPELTGGTCVARKVVEMSETEKVATVKAALDLATKTFTAAGDVDLPAPSVSGVNVTWASSNTDLVTVAEDNSKITIASIPATATTVTLTATITSATDATATDTKTIEITVAPATEEVVGTYQMKLDQVQAGKKLYFNGTINNGRGATTELASEATNITLASTAGGHVLKIDGKYLEVVKSGTYINMALNATRSGVWVYDSTLEVYTWTLESKVYYLGAYNANTTISASETSYISGDNASKVGVSQFPVKLVDLSARTPAEKIADALSFVNDTLNVTAAGEVTLPASTEADVTFVWSTTDTTYTVSENKLNVAALPATDTTITLTLTASVDTTSDTKTMTVNIKGEDSSMPTWTKVTSANASELKVGATIILSYGSNAMGAQSGNFRTAVSFDATNVSDSVMTITLEAASEGKFYLKVSDGYLTAPTGDSNYLYTKTSPESDGSSEWTIVVDADGNATITPTTTSNSRVLQYNSNSGQERFSCYKANQKSCVIYVLL